MKQVIAYLILVLTAASLWPPKYELLLAFWGILTAAWLARQKNTWPVIVCAILLAVALLLPIRTPDTWAPLLRLGLTACVWTVILGLSLRLIAARQPGEKHWPQISK